MKRKNIQKHQTVIAKATPATSNFEVLMSESNGQFTSAELIFLAYICRVYIVWKVRENHIKINKTLESQKVKDFEKIV